MRFYRHLYIGRSLKGRESNIIRKLNEGRLMTSTYIITLAKGEQNHLEFYSSLLLAQKFFSAEKALVIGIAGSYDEAVVLVEEITREVYDKTKGCDIRSYILKQNSRG